MSSYYARGVIAALGLLGLVSSASAADFGSPSLLPIPSAYRNYPVTPVGYRGRNGGPAENLPSPSDSHVPMPAGQESIPSPQPQTQSMSGGYQEAMSNDWSTPTSGGCNQGGGSCYDGQS